MAGREKRGSEGSDLPGWAAAPFQSWCWPARVSLTPRLRRVHWRGYQSTLDKFAIWWSETYKYFFFINNFLKQCIFIILESCRLEVQNGSPEAKIKVLAVSSREEFVSLSFSASTHIPCIVAHASSHLSPASCFCHLLSGFFWSQISLCLPLVIMFRAHPDNPGRRCRFEDW